MNENQPAKRFSRGRCNVSIFFNEIQKNDQTIKIPKAVFQKRYRDKKGNWQTTTTLDTHDIPKAVLCLNDAYDYLTRPAESKNSNTSSE